MGGVSNFQSMPVFEQLSGIAFEVNILGVNANKDNLLKKSRSEDVISIEMFSPPLQESTSVNNLVLLQAKTGHQRRFLNCMLENGRLPLIFSFIPTDSSEYCHTDFTGLAR